MQIAGSAGRPLTSVVAVSTSVAPKAASTLRRSRLMVSGMVSVRR